MNYITNKFEPYRNLL